MKDLVASAIVRAVAENNSQLAMAQVSRYFKVNLQALRAHGTIEFRQHSGTTEAAKISNWVRFLLTFVERSVEISAQAPITLVTTVRTAAQPDTPAPIGRAPRHDSVRHRVLQCALSGQSATEITVNLNLSTNNVRHRMAVIIRDYQLPLTEIGHGPHTRWTRPMIAQAPKTVTTVDEVASVVVDDSSPFDGCTEAVREFYVRRAAKFAGR